MKNLILTFLTLMMFHLSAQKTVYLKINHKLSANVFEFNKKDSTNLNYPFVFTRVDYYISNISIIHDGGMEKKIPIVILIKGSYNINESLGSFTDITNIEGIKFSIGVDTPTNHDDPALQSGPLAPQLPAMHWGWLAGYRFIALEGKTGSSLNTNFEIHALGDKNYFSQMVTLIGSKAGNKITVNIDADYTKALKGINISTGPIDHGVDLTDLAAIINFRDNVFKATTLSSAKDILTFSVPNMVGTPIITSNSITAKVTLNTDLTNLIATMAVSNNASLSPNSGVAQNFTTPVDFVVNAQDNSTKTYKVTISKDGNVSIHSAEQNILSLYPNPCTGISHIQFDKNSSSISYIQVYDIYGKLIQEINPKLDSEINISKCAKGIYFVKALTSQYGSSIQKLVLE